MQEDAARSTTHNTVSVHTMLANIQ